MPVSQLLEMMGGGHSLLRKLRNVQFHLTTEEHSSG